MLLRTTAWIVVFAGLSGFAQPLPAQDWPTFRGNSLQTGRADTPLPDALAVRWSFPAKTKIDGSPIIFEQTVFFATSAGKVHALDLASGKKKWEYSAAGILATPAARAGAVFVGDIDGYFHCIDAATGKKRWIVEAGAAINSPANFADDKILFGSDDHNLYCVSRAGKILWQCETGEKIRAAPAVLQDGTRALVGGCDNILHIVDLVKGEETGAIHLGGHIAASVAVHGDRAYVGNMANQMLTIDWKKKEVLWQFIIPPKAQAYFSSPAVTEDLVIVGGRDKVVHAWKRDTGKAAWKFPTKGRVDSSPVIAGQRVIVGSLDGHLYVLDLTKGRELARFDLGPIAGSPAVGGGCVVVTTTEGDVVCLGAKK